MITISVEYNLRTIMSVLQCIASADFWIVFIIDEGERFECALIETGVARSQLCVLRSCKVQKH